MVEQIVAFCLQLGAGQEQMLQPLAVSAREQLLARLRPGVTEADCGEVFPLACAMLVMEQLRVSRGYSMILLMLTDVLAEGSHLLYLGDEDIFRQAFNTELKDHACFLPGIVSRKKQIIPMLTALWG